MIWNLTGAHFEREMTIGGIVSSEKRITTKRGDMMMTLELDDLTGKITAVLFPKVFERIRNEHYIGVDEYCLFVTGTLDKRGGERQFVVRDIKKGSIETMRVNAKEAGVFDEHEVAFVSNGHGVDNTDEVGEVEGVEYGDNPRVATVRPTVVATNDESSLRDITDMVAKFAYDKLQDTTRNTFTDDEEGEIMYRLKADLSGADLQKVRTILEGHPGKKSVKLDLLVEGNRRVVDTKIRIKHTGSLLQEMSPYIDG